MDELKDDMNNIKDDMDDSRDDIRMSLVVIVGTAEDSKWMTAWHSRRKHREN